MSWQYGLVKQGDTWGVHEIYLDDDDGEVKLSWTAEPLHLGGFENMDEAVAAVVMMAEDIESRRCVAVDNEVETLAVEDE